VGACGASSWIRHPTIRTLGCCYVWPWSSATSIPLGEGAQAGRAAFAAPEPSRFPPSRAVLPARAGCGDGVAALGIQDARGGPRYDVGGDRVHSGRTGLYGDDDGNLVALDSRSGKDLWHFYTGHTLTLADDFPADGRPVRDNRAESDVFTFALFRGEGK